MTKISQVKDSDRLLPISLGGKWGYIDLSGEIKIPCEFIHAGEFSNGLAVVTRKNTVSSGRVVTQNSVIDVTGSEKWQFECNGCWGDFSENLIWIETNNETAYYDVNGDQAISSLFGAAADFCSGVARVWKNEFVGMIKSNGDWLVEPRFRSLWDFSIDEQVTAFQVVSGGDPWIDDQVNPTWGLISIEGNVLVEPHYWHLGVPCKGVVVAANSSGNLDLKFGFVDMSGDWIVEPVFERCHDAFNESSVAARFENQWGLVDGQGYWILEPQFDDCSAFHDGLSAVCFGGRRKDGIISGEGKYGFVNRYGDIVIRPTFDYVRPFHGGVARVELQDRRWGTNSAKFGYIDKEGYYIWEPTE